MGFLDLFKREKESQSSNKDGMIDKEPLQRNQTHTTQTDPTKSTSDLLANEMLYGEWSIKGFKTQDWHEALRVFQKLEDDGLAEASIALGQFAQISDKERAFQHFKKASDANIAEGAWGCAAILGHSYIADINGEDREWYDYCLKAANGGCSDAMNELANMYNRINDYLGAYYWYQMATYYEHPEGPASVAGIVSKWKMDGTPALSTNIDGVRPNDVKNTVKIFRCLADLDTLDQQRMNEFFTAAMEGNNEIMCLFIGHFFEDVVKNYENAKLGYQLAAHNNSIMGMKYLADMLVTGRGCEKDTRKALEWYKEAATAGERTSCFVMGEFSRKTNINFAAYWYSLAYRRGYEHAFYRLKQL